MDEGCAWKVVVRAYTICLLCVGQRLDGAAVHFIVLPQARRGNERAGVSRTAIRGCHHCCVLGLSPRTTQRLANEHLSESHEYCCEHAGGVSRNGACVNPATLMFEGAAAQRCSQPDTRWRR